MYRHKQREASIYEVWRSGEVLPPHSCWLPSSAVDSYWEHARPLLKVVSSGCAGENSVVTLKKACEDLDSPHCVTVVDIIWNVYTHLEEGQGGQWTWRRGRVGSGLSVSDDRRHSLSLCQRAAPVWSQSLELCAQHCTQHSKFSCTLRHMHLQQDTPSDIAATDLISTTIEFS